MKMPYLGSRIAERAVATTDSMPAKYVHVQLVVIVLLTVSFFTLMLRFYTRTVLIRKLGWDDAMMGIAFVCPPVFIFFAPANNILVALLPWWKRNWPAVHQRCRV